MRTPFAASESMTSTALRPSGMGYAWRTPGCPSGRRPSGSVRGDGVDSVEVISGVPAYGIPWLSMVSTVRRPCRRFGNRTSSADATRRTLGVAAVLTP